MYRPATKTDVKFGESCKSIAARLELPKLVYSRPTLNVARLCRTSSRPYMRLNSPFIVGHGTIYIGPNVNLRSIYHHASIPT